MLEVNPFSPFTIRSLDDIVNYLDYDWDWGLDLSELNGFFNKYDSKND
jgi:hypothetical protein